jgi:hypothetical protein
MDANQRESFRLTIDKLSGNNYSDCMKVGLRLWLPPDRGKGVRQICLKRSGDDEGMSL